MAGWLSFDHHLIHPHSSSQYLGRYLGEGTITAALVPILGS